MTDPAAALELRDVTKSFGSVVALRSGSLRAEAGSIHGLVGENGAGKSTLVKVVAGVHRRDGGEFLLDGDPTDFGSTAESKAAGIAVIYQEPTLFPDLSVTENIFMGRQPFGRGRRIDRGAMYDEAERLFDRPRREHRPASSRARPVHRRPADHRDREGHLPRRAGADHGRADRGAERRRGGAALHRRAPAARRGPGAGVHLPPLRRGVRAVRHGHRDARRRLHRHAEHRGHDVDTLVAPDGRPRGRRPLPEDAGQRRRARARGRGPEPAGGLPRRHASRSGPGRSSASPDWSARAAARSPAPSSGSTRYDSRRGPPARQGRCRRAARAPRSGPAWRSSPRTVASRDWSPTPPSRTTSPP